MEKVIKIVNLKDVQTDYIFWQTKSFQERLEAIEFLRMQYIKFRKDVQPRLQRVCRVVDNDLTLNKKASGRRKDLDDIDNLG